MRRGRPRGGTHLEGERRVRAGGAREADLRGGGSQFILGDTLVVAVVLLPHALDDEGGGPSDEASLGWERQGMRIFILK